jgi:hypothetical protein
MMSSPICTCTTVAVALHMLNQRLGRGVLPVAKGAGTCKPALENKPSTSALGVCGQGAAVEGMEYVNALPLRFPAQCCHSSCRTQNSRVDAGDAPQRNVEHG